MDAEYRKERSLRRKLEKEHKKYGSESTLQLYNVQRDHCVYLANFKMKSYYSNLLASTDNQATLFKTVSKLWNRSKTKILPEDCGKDQDLANQFNNYFSDKIHSIRTSFNTNQVISQSESQSAISKSQVSLDNFAPATLDELNEILSDTDIKTSPDDPIPAPLLKKSISVLMLHILDLVNLSLSTGDISGLKESVIIPILKKSGLDKNKLVNYRPIINLQFLSK